MSALPFLPLVVIMVDHEEAVVVEVTVVRVMGMTCREADTLVARNLRSAPTATAIIIQRVTVGISMANPLGLPGFFPG